ncbi:hypothetical protein PUN4_520095 [Paraburkholderia unamae]|nr:hypothetical protein PUN4_520095 [Paraburkholderia unamae]
MRSANSGVVIGSMTTLLILYVERCLFKGFPVLQNVDGLFKLTCFRPDNSYFQ